MKSQVKEGKQSARIKSRALARAHFPTRLRIITTRICAPAIAQRAQVYTRAHSYNNNCVSQHIEAVGVVGRTYLSRSAGFASHYTGRFATAFICSLSPSLHTHRAIHLLLPTSICTLGAIGLLSLPLFLYSPRIIYL